MRKWEFWGGLGAGAAVMYLIDPGAGRRGIGRMRRGAARMADGTGAVLGRATPGGWPPKVRLAATGAGGGLVAWGAVRKGWMGAAVGTAGAGLLVGGLAGRAALHRTGERGPVDTWMDVTVAAPRVQVFELWTRYENFPRFLPRLIEVKDLGGGRSRWTAAGPDGPIRWQARLTQRVAGRLLAWESLPGAAVRNAGTLRFEEAGDGATRVSLHLTYAPTAGALGPFAALLFGKGPGGSLDEDLRRMKAFVEMGAAAGAGP